MFSSRKLVLIAVDVLEHAVSYLTGVVQLVERQRQQRNSSGTATKGAADVALCFSLVDPGPLRGPKACLLQTAACRNYAWMQ